MDSHQQVTKTETHSAQDISRQDNAQTFAAQIRGHWRNFMPKRNFGNKT